jgi:hypothetical protein
MSDLPAPGMMGMPPQQPQMMPNPAFEQWMQEKQAYDEEAKRRQTEFLSACELIKSDAPNAYKIDIEADSTIAADEQEEKAARTEFVKEFTPFMQAAVAGIAGSPDLAPLVKEMALFWVRGFKVSRQLEEVIETTFDALMKQAQQNPAQPPQKGGNTKSPMEIQAETQQAQTKAQTEVLDSQSKLRIAQQQDATKQMQILADSQIEREKLAAQQSKDQTELAMRGREMEGREYVEHMRMQHMAERDTKGLV